jgi:hypothetical protein
MKLELTKYLEKVNTLWINQPNVLDLQGTFQPAALHNRTKP